MTQEQIDRKSKVRLDPQPVPIRPPEARIRDFEPEKLAYDPQAAMAEATRCLLCPKQPCVDACPIHNNIPAAMRLIAEGQFVEAAQVYRTTSTLPEVCSRVCPQEVLWDGACVLGKRGSPVALGALERFVTDVAPADAAAVTRSPSTGKRVAVVGAGPAGLTVTQRLLERGHSVTVYEAWPAAGGWMTYTIPTYKLPRELIHAKIAFLEALGATFFYNTRVGEAVALDDLRHQYDAVFLGVGAMIDAPADFEGCDLPGVYSGTEFLLPVYTPQHLMPAGTLLPELGRHVVVFGGGDTAMDCVRTAVRLQVRQGWDPNVTLVYRRTEHEMPAALHERKMALEEGGKFVFLAAPLIFKAGENGRLKEIVIQRMRLGEPDRSGRPSPVPIEGDTYSMEADMAVLALGYWPDPLLSQHAPMLKTHKWGLIVANEATGETNLPGVFAGGDAVRGPNLVSRAVRDGNVAASSIHAYLDGA